MDQSSWIADGTAEVEPVTTETPDTNAPEILPEGAVEAVAGGPTDEGQPRDEHGRFAPKAPAAETSAEGSAPVEEAQAAAEAIQAFIEGKLGDQPYKLPENVLLPLKRGEEVAYEPVTNILKYGMMERDYRLNNQTLKDQRAAFEAERARFSAEQARAEARAKYIEEREAEIRAAMTDPQQAAAYQEHLRQYQTNPMYKKHVDAALDQRETAAQLEAYQKVEDQRVIEHASSTARGWIEGLAEDFPGVDPNRVAQIYGQRLSAGSARLDPTDVRAIYQAEADYLATSVSPLQQQLADLTAQVEALKAKSAADQHNETTTHALARAKAPPVATGAGAPVRTPTKPGRFSPNELQERNSEWVKAGRA